MATGIGIVDVWWKGQQFSCLKGSTVRLPGFKNNTVNAGRTSHRTPEFMNGEIKITTLLLEGQSLSFFNPNDGDGELQVKANTGTSWSFPDAYVTEMPTVNDDGGKIQVTFHCSTSREIIAN